MRQACPRSSFSRATSSEKTRSVHTRTLTLFKGLANAALAATDVAARGIYIDKISLVVHVDVPQDHKYYLHRSGHSARPRETPKSVFCYFAQHRLNANYRGTRANRFSYVAAFVENKRPSRGTRKLHPNSAQRRRGPRQFRFILLP